MYQVHNKSNWAQAIVAALPHLLLALLFAFHQWHNIAWLSGVFISILCVVAYGWRRNKPTWLFSWLGYALVPFLIVTFVLLIFVVKALPFLPIKDFAPSWWVWIAAIVYFPIALWLFISIAIRTVKRDWLLASLMALPIPAIAGWLLVVKREGGGLGISQETFKGLEPVIALSFLALASVVMIFTRITQRRIKAGALFIAGFAILGIIAFSSHGELNIINLIAMIVVTGTLLIGPALLEHKVGRYQSEPKDWIYPELEQSPLK
jgi:hypothetical protein